MREGLRASSARERLDPLAAPAARRALVAIALVLGAALVGAAIRLVPWTLDPTIGARTIAPFAKSLAAVACEAAILIGWPVGWALATQQLVERGEARVLASLGERPSRTVARLLPQAALFSAALALSSVVLGRDAAAPGRIVAELLEEGRRSCAPGEAHAIPFASATWLCPTPGALDGAPRLVGRAPVGGGAVFTAEDALVADDLRRIELSGVRLALGSPAGEVRVRVGALVVRGLAPWANPSSLPPALRAVAVTGAALLAGCASALALLRARRRIGGVVAAAIGAAGPLTALATLRALELRVPDAAPGAWLALFALVPAAALAGAIGAFALVAALPEPRGAGSR